MPLATFPALEKWLISNTPLKKSRKGLATVQKLVMFFCKLWEKDLEIEPYKNDFSIPERQYREFFMKF